MTDQQQMLQDLHGLLSIQSVTDTGPAHMPFGAGPTQALEYILQVCDRLGFSTKNCDNKVGFAEIGQGEEIVGVLVHLDVVPAGEGWDYPPFACTQANGRLYGRGMIDDKGPAIACIYAMKDLLSTPLKRRIRIIFGLGEEGGDWSDVAHYVKTEQVPVCGFTPDAIFPVIYGEKGIATLRLTLPLEGSGVSWIAGGQAENMVADHCAATVDGVTHQRRGRGAHASKPHEGQNAISMLMADLAGIPLADFYNACIGFDLHGERVNCDLSDEHTGRLTLNVGKVGVEGENIVFTLDLRHPAAYTAQEVQDRLSAAVAPYGGVVEEAYTLRSLYLDRNGPLITTLEGAYRDITGDQTTQPVVIGGGTYAKTMDNIAAFGPLLPGREPTEHQPNESIDLEDFLLLREIYRTALERLANLEQI